MIFSMAVFDDGGGPQLYVGGWLSSAPQFGLIRNIAKWNGQEWSSVGQGLGDGAYHMTAFDDGRGPSLFVESSAVFGQMAPQSLVQWVGCNGQCYPNCDNSTISPALNVADFSCFLRNFAARNPYADGNVDGVLDIADFTGFLQRFSAGCP